MWTRKLAVEGAVEFSPPIVTDERGCFVSPYQEAAFVAAVGKPLFAVAQTNISLSRRGVVRGVHYTTTPPGTAKLVYRMHGRVLDIVVDVRVGSPTYGRWDAVVLDPDVSRASYLPLGVGHAFVAIEDESVMSYLLSQSYVPENELALSVLDPEIGLPIPRGHRAGAVGAGPEGTQPGRGTRAGSASGLCHVPADRGGPAGRRPEPGVGMTRCPTSGGPSRGMFMPGRHRS